MRPPSRSPLRFAPLLALALYLPHLGHAPLLDEVFGIGEEGIRGSLAAYLTHADEGFMLHRPVSRASFWLSYRLSFGSIEVERLVNVGLLGVTAYVWPLGTVPRAVLLLHPLLSFATTYAVQRPVLLALLFLGLAVRARSVPGAFLAAGLACASKEIGVLAFPLLAVTRKDARWVLPYLGAVLVGVCLAPGLDASSSKGFDVTSRLFMQPYAWGVYLREILLPLPGFLSLERPFTGYEWLGSLWFLYPALLGFAVVEGLPGVALAVLSLLPESGPFLLEPVFDHRAIVPLVLLLFFHGHRIPRLVLAPLLVCQLAFLPVWGFMEAHGASLYPRHWRANYHAGVEIQDRSALVRAHTEGTPLLVEALPYYLAAIEARPEFLPTYVNLGVAYWDLGHLPEGVETTLRAVPWYDGTWHAGNEAACMNLRSWFTLAPRSQQERILQGLAACYAPKETS